jgi:hypothetical protein
VDLGADLVLVFAVVYNLVFLSIWRRAARHYRSDLRVSAWLGLGWRLFREDTYTSAGEPYRRLLILLAVGALPLLLLVLWLTSLLAQ